MVLYGMEWYVCDAGISKVFCGHQPHGDHPVVLQSESPAGLGKELQVNRAVGLLHHGNVFIQRVYAHTVTLHHTALYHTYDIILYLLYYAIQHCTVK